MLCITKKKLVYPFTLPQCLLQSLKKINTVLGFYGNVYGFVRLLQRRWAVFYGTFQNDHHLLSSNEIKYIYPLLHAAITKNRLT